MERSFFGIHYRQEVLRLPGTTEPGDFVSTKRIAYSSDGKLLITCDKNQVKIYDPASGDLIKTLDGQQTDVTAVAISMDGKHIASGDIDGSVVIWDGPADDSPMKLAGHTESIEEITFSPDGKWLVTAGDDAALKIWDVLSGDILQDYMGFTGVVVGVTFSPDGKRFAFSDGAIHVWQFKTGSAKIRLRSLTRNSSQYRMQGLILSVRMAVSWPGSMGITSNCGMQSPDVNCSH